MEAFNSKPRTRWIGIIAFFCAFGALKDFIDAIGIFFEDPQLITTDAAAFCILRVFFTAMYLIAIFGIFMKDLRGFYLFGLCLILNIIFSIFADIILEPRGAHFEHTVWTVIVKAIFSLLLLTLMWSTRAYYFKPQYSKTHS